MCALVVAGMAGCYERVVGAQGFGAQSAQVYKANGPDTTQSSKPFTYKKSTTPEIPSPGAPQE